MFVCVDFNKTLNTIIDSDHCVLPILEDIYAHLNDSRYFTVIDLKRVYQQLERNLKNFLQSIYIRLIQI